MGSGPEAIEIDGRRLAWHSAGRGPALLLINGYASTGADWDPTFLAGLAESFEVICPDNRGAGVSDLGDGELTVDGMAADLEALLDALGIERLPVVGWSLGGFVAQRLAARAPGRVAALALLATDPGAPDSVAAEPSDWARLIDPSGSSREQASRLISLLFPPELAADIDARFGDVVAAARAQLLPETLRAQEAAMDAWHREEPPRPEGGGVPPTLIVHGELDRVIPVANTGPLAARWPGARVELLPGCGHALMAQEPAAVVSPIRALAGR
jgi:3-oxoadipate enol-lactonase